MNNMIVNFIMLCTLVEDGAGGNVNGNFIVIKE